MATLESNRSRQDKSITPSMVVKGKVMPIVEVKEFGDLDEVMKTLAKYEVRGMIVVNIPL